jgi:hypothetical protein
MHSDKKLALLQKIKAFISIFYVLQTLSSISSFKLIKRIVTKDTLACRTRFCLRAATYALWKRRHPRRLALRVRFGTKGVDLGAR